MKIFSLGLLFLLLISIFIIYGNTKSKFAKTALINIDKNKTIVKKVKAHTALLKTFAQKNNFTTDYCFLIDMKIPSGQNRFFIVDLKADTIITAGLVTHGSGSETNADSLVFSNIANSGATSVGKYKIGNEYNGKFGTAFKLHGLDTSNSNAFERFVVLHSHACVPNHEVYTYQICNSLGCPTVSTSFLPILKSYINKVNKPILLWIYY